MVFFRNVNSIQSSDVLTIPIMPRKELRFLVEEPGDDPLAAFSI
jgi:hypothetical protein